jgi:FkbM family methyltransferase
MNGFRMSVHYRFLHEYLPETTGVVVDVVDIGANPIDGDPPYKPLLAQGRARVLGFEPAAEAFAALEQAKGPNERYLRLAAGDGGEHALHVCAAPGMTSLLEPNEEVLRHFHRFDVWGAVAREERVWTVHLDDVEQVANIDMLKIDVQGFELPIMRHGQKRLDDAVVIQTEVEFLPLYKDQALFADVDAHLRSRGFVLHRFWPLKARTIRPMLINGDIYASLGQLVDADAVYVRDFTKLERLSEDKLLKTAILANDIYGSFDLALVALRELDRRNGGSLAGRYVAGLNGTPGGAHFTLG